LSDFTGGMNQVGKACAITGAAITGAIGGVFAASSKVGMEFEASMSKVQAVMGASAEELKALEKAARDAGAKTTKSASEAANALEYMGLAGWSVKESQEALMPVLRLSEAASMDLGLTSDLVTDSMSSLGLKMSEVGQSGLENYLDMVAKTSNSSNTSIQQLMEGLIVVGGTAKNLNVPMEELNAIMGIMANRGLKGLNENSSPVIEKLVA
ncbi:MAG: phage tail tape measure protein, partial [Cellulosilyticum sp.]|nr:phage tail tape measure protein [Cellulosilyticum sp.]